MPAEQDILNALRAIIDPDFNKDIVSLGFVKNIQIKGGHVSFDIVLTTPACPVKSEFEQKAQKYVGRIPGVSSVKVNMTSQPAKSQTPTPSGPNPFSKIGSVIAVSSCKGGVGKSTVAAHLAQELASRGFKVGLCDVDIHGPSVPGLFHFESTKIYANEQNQLIPLEKNNLKIMSFGFLLGDAPAVMRGPIVTRYVQQLLFNTAWGELDYLFIDMPPGTGDVQLTITQSIRLNGAVIITTPQTLSLMDVSRGILMFERVNVPILGVIENMSFFVCDQCQKKHYIFGTNKSRGLIHQAQPQGVINHAPTCFGVELLAELPLLPEFILKVDEIHGNKFVKEAVDRVVMALGKKNIEQREVPQIEFNAREVILSWKDGSRWVMNNRDLRLSCRCALCVIELPSIKQNFKSPDSVDKANGRFEVEKEKLNNEMTGEKTLQEKDVPADIAAKEIIPLGNYALGIIWNDGHSSGIYPYEAIKNFVGV